MTDIYFIRHGQASFGERNYDQLSERGRDQAFLLADYLIDMEAYFPVVFSGSKRRQMEPATPSVSRLK
jgi:broad specificity phosphatase PhoE